MRTGSRARGATVVVVAALLLLTAWTSVGERSAARAESLRDSAHSIETGRAVNTTSSSVNVADAVVAPVLAGVRVTELRISPIGALAELIAAALILCVFRRLRNAPEAAVRRSVLRGRIARRAPPLESFA